MINLLRAIGAMASGFSSAFLYSVNNHSKEIRAWGESDKRHIESLKQTTEALQKMSWSASQPCGAVDQDACEKMEKMNA